MSQLFSPLTLRGLTLRNRTVVAPMCQYSAQMGLANDWHLVHLGRFAIGGFGLVIVEATGVEPRGRITYGCLGLWSDAQIAPLGRIVDFVHAQGAAIGIQLAHAGRKASSPLPFLKDPDAEQKARHSYEDWQPVAPSAFPHDAGSKVPHALTLEEIAGIRTAFVDAAKRAGTAGFDVIELHCAHGYLLNEFLSPLANRREDQYGGARENRMRLPLEIAEAVRKVWPADKPLFARISTTDWHTDGWQVEDSVVLARAFKARGVDVIDCSSGGFAESRIEAGPGYQLGLADAVRKGADIATMTVGLMGDADMAAAAIAEGKADLVALARPALEDPNWPVRALAATGAPEVYALHAKQAGYAVRGLHKALDKA
ncbi:MAG: NADH:flavin oxidoreductase/NADH oxidase [Alphaproteobacteria bacterium]|nr:NADH:flavin oxidoreductase/NADH oxidase [Alphaproteobacteria bacterium]